MDTSDSSASGQPKSPVLPNTMNSEATTTRARTESVGTGISDAEQPEPSTHSEDDDEAFLCVTPTIVPLLPTLDQLYRASGAGSGDSVPLSLSLLPVHRTRTASDIYTKARDFSSLSDPVTVQRISHERVPGWIHLDYDSIVVDQLMSGLSNQLFKVQIREDVPGRARLPHPCVLFRIYGKDVASLYDPANELSVFKKLGKRGMAPRLIAEFEGGRIEEWIEGCVLDVTDMDAPTVMVGIASILAGLHQLDLSKSIDTTPTIPKLLSRWRENALTIYKNAAPDSPRYLALQRLNIPKLYEESFKLEELLLPKGIPANELTRLTFCHNDIQENNVMLTETVLRLIDFEYSGYNYPAYDLASYFWEMSCDYLVQGYPFFAFDPTKYPSLEKRRTFIALYLSKLYNESVKASETHRIDPLVDTVERFLLAAHMLWAFWAVVRAPQASTASDFDMLHYSQTRIDCYWTQKAKLISQGLIPDNEGHLHRLKPCCHCCHCCRCGV